ncbi:MAG TPA: glycosyltransferase family 2 protein [Chitinophagaceae bacterium]
MRSPKVYIVILNYRQWQDTQECLQSVLRSTYTNFSVFVVDNNSGNDSLARLASWLSNEQREFKTITKKEIQEVDLALLPQVTLVQNDSNAGFANGNNLMLAILKNENGYVWLLNPDMIIRENTLNELVRFAGTQSQESIIGAVIKNYEGNHKLLFYGGGKVNFYLATVQTITKPEDIRRLDYISGGCLFTQAINFKVLGLLPEEYFLYWEETDWCYRARQKGHPLLVCRRAIAYDKISTTIGKGFLANYYYARNGLLFISKFRKDNVPLVLFFVIWRWFKRVFTGRWSRAGGIYQGTRDFLKKKFHEYQ